MLANRNSGSSNRMYQCMYLLFPYLHVHDHISLCTVVTTAKCTDPAAAARQTQQQLGGDHVALWFQHPTHLVYLYDGARSSHLISTPSSPFTTSTGTVTTLECTSIESREWDGKDQVGNGPGAVVKSETNKKCEFVKMKSEDEDEDEDEINHDEEEEQHNPVIANNVDVKITATSAILPPRWLRSHCRGLNMRQVSVNEISIPLSSFTSIRDLTIACLRDPDNFCSTRHPQLIATIRSAFAQLRLESLTFEPISVSVQVAIFEEDKISQSRCIWSQCDLLICLRVIYPELSVPIILESLADRNWTKLESLTTAIGRLSRSHPEEWRKKVFSPSCLSVLKHLDLISVFHDETEMSEFHENMVAGLPQLTQLRTDSRLDIGTTSVARRPSCLFSMPPQLTRLVCVNAPLRCGIPTAKGLQTLILTGKEMEYLSSIDIFSIIGHHNLPHLATLSMPTTYDYGDSDQHQINHERVLDIMSGMTALTSLHYCGRAEYPIEPNTFHWFLHIYRFSSLKNLTFGTSPSVSEYRNVPLPLPAGMKLTPNQHPLYPDGGIHLVHEVQPSNGNTFKPVELPSWLNEDDFITLKRRSKRKEEVEFGLPNQPTIVYLDAKKFGEGGNKSLGKTENQKTMDICSRSTRNIPPGVFNDVITQLCMMTMLSHLPILERARAMRISRHFYHSVLHSSMWKNVTFHATDELQTTLPSSQVCELIGGLKVNTSSGFDHILSLPSLRRLTLEAEPNWDFRERESAIFDALSTLRLESIETNIVLHATPKYQHHHSLLRVCSAILGLSQEWSNGENEEEEEKEEAKEDKTEDQEKDETKEEDQKGSVVSSWSIGWRDADPIIWRYADSLRRVSFSIVWNEHTKVVHRMSERTWSQLHTLKLNYEPFSNIADTDSSNASNPSTTITDQVPLPFEDLLAQQARLLPQLTNLDISFKGCDGSRFPLRAFTRIFIALKEANTLTTIKHSLRNPPREYQQIYSVSLTSLSLHKQRIPWNEISQLSSLTELNIHPPRHVPPLVLFQAIGANRLPNLSSLHLSCRTFQYANEAACQHESFIVKEIMSKMTALTNLDCGLVKYLNGETATSFSWFAHAYLFPSLKKIEYALSLPGSDLYDTTVRHTLIPPPPASSSSSSSVPSLGSDPTSTCSYAPSHLLPTFYDLSSSHHYPPYSHPSPPSFHIFTSTMVANGVVSNLDVESIVNICVQEEYVHLSQEELRLLQQRMVEEGREIKLYDGRLVDGATLSSYPEEELFTLKPPSRNGAVVS